jgi:hypothetical protein
LPTEQPMQASTHSMSAGVCSKVRSMARSSLAIAPTLPIATATQCCCKHLLE